MNVRTEVLRALPRAHRQGATAEFEVGDGSTVSDLIEVVMREHPGLCPNPSALVAAVNQEYADHDHPLAEGDEVAFIPPVSGGAPSPDRGAR